MGLPSDAQPVSSLWLSQTDAIPLGLSYDEVLKKYVEYFVQWFSPSWHHIIVKAPFIDKVISSAMLDSANIGCYCVCSSMDKAHYHIIGNWLVSPRTVCRKFKEWNTEFQLPVTKGSNLLYKTIKIKDFGHFIRCCFYLVRQQPVRPSGHKHSDFLPFGTTLVSANSKFELGAPTEFWNSVDYILNQINPSLFAEAKETYKEFQKKSAEARRAALYSKISRPRDQYVHTRTDDTVARGDRSYQSCNEFILANYYTGRNGDQSSITHVPQKTTPKFMD